MKKGFTLIELMIVMVIVGSLVAIGLPKYNRAMERGRALEGINKVKYAAEYAAAKCIASDGNVKSTTATDITKGAGTFGSPSISFSGCTVTAILARNTSSGWTYTLTAVSDGDATTVTCGGEDNDCEVLGLTEDDLLK